MSPFYFNQTNSTLRLEPNAHAESVTISGNAVVFANGLITDEFTHSDDDDDADASTTTATLSFSMFCINETNLYILFE
jgi:hypothetical protein